MKKILLASAVVVTLFNAAGDERGDPGVERVAAFQQDAEGGRGRERMTGGHATGRSHHRGSKRRSRGLAILNRHLPGAGCVKERNDEGRREQDLLHGYFFSGALSMVAFLMSVSFG